jgi:hypothetical protein
VSLIGSLEQFDLANILRRIEVFSKTGLLVVKQEEGLWVEFYFRQGQLVCMGPMRTNATLIDRLLQANLISAQVLPRVISIVSSVESNETRLALALINEGYLSREILRAWASQETSQVLQAIFTWPAGEIYFEDDCPTPADRLLVALSVASLLDVLSIPTFRPAGEGAPSTDEPANQPSRFMPDAAFSPQAGQINASQLIEGVPPFAAQAGASGGFSASQLIEGVPPFAAQAGASGGFSASQLIEELPSNLSGPLNMAQLVEDAPSAAFAAPVAPSTGTGFLGSEVDITVSTQSSLIPPQPVLNPLPPTRIDTSFMTPELVLVPSDLSSIRSRNPQVQLTPDQWRVFVLIDGQVSLQILCQILMAPAEQLCVLAGELIAMGLVMPFPQATHPFNDPSTGARDYGLGGGVNFNPQMPQGPYAMQSPAWNPQATGAQSGPFGGPIETQSQWGNGNNGATFMVGGGWVLSSRQAMPQPGQSSAAYASVSGQY